MKYIWYGREKEQQKRLVRWLIRKGWKVEVERPARGIKTLNGGRMDIYAKRKEREIIIEVKSSDDLGSIAKGIRQLERYSQDYPNAELYLAFPRWLRKRGAAKLIAKGIGFCLNGPEVAFPDEHRYPL